MYTTHRNAPVWLKSIDGTDGHTIVLGTDESRSSMHTQMQHTHRVTKASHCLKTFMDAKVTDVSTHHLDFRACEGASGRLQVPE